MDEDVRDRITRWTAFRIKQLDVVEPMSQNARARQIGIDKGTLSKVVRGTWVSLGLDVFIHLVDGLGLDATTVLSRPPNDGRGSNGASKNRHRTKGSV